MGIASHFDGLNGTTHCPLVHVKDDELESSQSDRLAVCRLEAKGQVDFGIRVEVQLGVVATRVAAVPFHGFRRAVRGRSSHDEVNCLAVYPGNIHVADFLCASIRT